MNQPFAGAGRFAPSLAMLVIGACAFFDPLDQDGLRVILLPQDTALYVGAHLQARGLMVNSYGDQYPSEQITYVGLDPGASVASGGRVTGIAYARVRVVVVREPFADTGWVSIVPTGTLALSRMSDQSRVDIVNVDGSGLVSPVSSGQITGGSPSWLPGDTAFVYQYAIPGGAGSTQLFVGDLAGNTRLLHPSGRDPRVSRDGAWVYFDNAAEIWRVRVDGSAAERVAMGGDAYPDPSPDGTQLVSIELATGRLELAVRTLSSGVKQLLGVSGWFPRWNPEGDSIAYWSAPDLWSEAGAIFVVGADGSGARQVSLAGRVYRSECLDWSPDGQWLLARSASTLDLIHVATGLTLPLGYGAGHYRATWRW